MLVDEIWDFKSINMGRELDTTNWFFRYVTYKNQNPDFYPYVPKST